MSDDLSAPLGKRSQRGGAKLSQAAPALIAGALGLCLLAFALWTIMVNDPLGGEPTAIVEIDAGGKAAPDKAEPGASAQAVVKPVPDGEAPASPSANPANPPAKTITIIDGTSGNRQEVVIPGQGAAAKPAQSDTKLLETSRHGMIPRIGADGARPMVVFAGAAPAAAKPNTPRIALVVSGLGISGNSTAEAFAKLPAPVTFALSPYGADLERWASRARGEGHELLLQVPMEPLDYPENDPGPQTLLTSLPPEQNIDRLHWVMSRFQGYVGIINFMGARFSATEASIAPILRETAKRGLLFVDDASSPRSLAGQIAGASSLPFAKAGIVLDGVATSGDIDRALGRLESMANDNGIAIGYASARPISIDRLSAWAKAADARGFQLVPITAAISKPKSNI